LIFRRLVMSMLMMGSFFVAHAQTDTGISGTITDTSGAVIAGAGITATNTISKLASNAATDASGNYVILRLKPGNYSVVVTKDGFQTVTFAAVQVIPNKLASLSASLPTGSVDTSVSVTSGIDGATVQPTQQDVFTSDQQLRVLDSKQIEAAGPVAGSAQIIAETPGA